jgi:hypothetical protein
MVNLIEAGNNQLPDIAHLANRFGPKWPGSNAAQRLQKRLR